MIWKSLDLDDNHERKMCGKDGMENAKSKKQIHSRLIRGVLSNAAPSIIIHRDILDRQRLFNQNIKIRNIKLRVSRSLM